LQRPLADGLFQERRPFAWGGPMDG
jgi:hypothetical protein